MIRLQPASSSFHIKIDNDIEYPNREKPNCTISYLKKNYHLILIQNDYAYAYFYFRNKILRCFSLLFGQSVRSTLV